MTVSLLTRGYVSSMRKIVQQVPISPTEGQELLARSLQVPLPPSMTNTLGIHQSDVIIRTAIVESIKDLRANPWLLDYVFSSLAKDEITSHQYGEQSIQRAKKWFQSTHIYVSMVPNLDEAKLPSISIKLLSSGEIESTLGDIHYDENEENDADWPALTSAFTPTRYNASTGIMAIPTQISQSLILAPGMVIVDAVGRSHEIQEILEDGTLLIEQGTVADFTNSVIKGQRPSSLTNLESVVYKETYQIGVHVSGEPERLHWLHSIVTFILLRYKQVLLEARGFERSVFSSSDFDRSDFSEAEFVYSRYISITGYVRQYWPKDINPKVTGVASQIKVTGSENLPEETDVDSVTWIGELDSIGKPKL